jgi:hypothetical protein
LCLKKGFLCCVTSSRNFELILMRSPYVILLLPHVKCVWCTLYLYLENQRFPSLLCMYEHYSDQCVQFRLPIFKKFLVLWKWLLFSLLLLLFLLLPSLSYMPPSPKYVTVGNVSFCCWTLQVCSYINIYKWWYFSLPSLSLLFH